MNNEDEPTEFVITAMDTDQISNWSTINIDDIIKDLPTVDMSSTNYQAPVTSLPSLSSYSININSNGTTGSNQYAYTNPSPYTWSGVPTGLHVSGDSEFEGDIKIKGVSIMETLQKIEKRLNILVPNPEKLEHFEALKKAYEHYKTLEALCELPPKEEE